MLRQSPTVFFAARCNTKTEGHFIREQAAYDLPKTNPFLRRMFSHIAGPDLDERLVWIVNDLTSILERADMSAILKDFGRSTRREDPVVHFYETFLAAYDPKMREARGVYYTPEPVVSYIVRSVDHILKNDFGLKDGLADATKIKLKDATDKTEKEIHRVLILDPATGTGTFLHQVIHQIHDTLCAQGQQGAWSGKNGYVSRHLLPRLFGFELLMAPYAVAHMKVGLLLDQTGYDFGSDERLRIYLTNTLEEAFKMGDLPLFARWLAEEVDAAGEVKKNIPVMVILGNPPYANFGRMNRNPWILGLLNDYKKDLNEKKLNLDDDFIKFIRFAQWRIEKTGHGIVGFITSNTYLDGITHRRMRESLMQAFDEIYILDLHGSSKKRERTPDGGKDENVFDITVGVSILLAVRLAEIETPSGGRAPARIFHAELWGERQGKYDWLWQNDAQTTPWTKLSPTEPHFFFVPKDGGGRSEFEQSWSIRDAFLVSGNAVKTERDGLSIHFTEDGIRRMVKDFRTLDEKSIREKYALETDSRDWQVAKAKADVTANRQDTSFRFIRYRPFDIRHTWYSGQSRGFIGTPAFSVMRHMIAGQNLVLTCLRQTRRGETGTFFVGRGLICKDIISPYDIGTVFPLYLYPADDELDASAGCRPNFNPEFLKALAEKLKLPQAGPHGLPQGVTPEDIFHYAYATFHSPTYRTRYAEFLKIDFPRLLLTSDAGLFRNLCELGRDLVALHLLEEHPDSATRFPIAGDGAVEAVRYAEPGQGSDSGRVWINKTQYFEGVPPEIWAFHVGGYQVCQKWLKDRKGRRLSYDDITHYQRIVAALGETIRLMAEIDRVIEAHGGWPLK